MYLVAQATEVPDGLVLVLGGRSELHTFVLPGDSGIKVALVALRLL